MKHQNFSGQELRDGTNDTPAKEANESQDIPIHYVKLPEGSGSQGDEVVPSDDCRPQGGNYADVGSK